MNARAIIVLALAGLVVVFALQNAELVSIRFLTWRAEAPRVVVLLTVLAVGIFAGWVWRGVVHRRRNKTRAR